jgi:hypothetical protein
LRRSLPFVDNGQHCSTLRIDGNPLHEFGWQICLVIDRLNWTDRDTCLAENARLRIDVEHVVVAMETRYRTNRYALGVSAISALFGDDDCHRKYAFYAVP